MRVLVVLLTNYTKSVNPGGDGGGIKAESLHEAKVIYRSMEHAVRLLFPQVLVLLKLLLVCPVSSCECERSFSALRRLKTWLRTTMIQCRLICHVHQEQLDNVNVHER